MPTSAAPPSAPAVTVRSAVEQDADVILGFVRDLAEFEKELHSVKATAEDFRRDGWGPDPVFQALVAEVDGEPAGFALTFRTYSTWEGRHGIFVEDLYVKPEARRYGVGRALLTEIARRAVAAGCRRVDLNVLNWNPARDFYSRIGLTHMEEWLPYRLTGTALADLAAQGA